MKVKNRNVNAINGTEKGRIRRRIWQDRQLYLMISIPLIFLFLFSYWPMYGVLIAFQKFSPTRGVFGSKWIGLANFKRFFSTPSATRTIANTFRLSLYSLIAGIPFPILLAILLNECRGLRYKKAIQMITYAPYFISTVVMVAILFQLLDPRTGLVNIFLNKLGIGPVDFMTDQSLFRSVYVWSGIWQGAGFNAIIYISALSAIDQELYEAARIDGANSWQLTTKIITPNMKPVLRVSIVLITTSSFKAFDSIYVMTGGGPAHATEVMASHMYNKAFLQLNYGYGCAIGLILFLFCLVFSGVIQTILKDRG